jgi:superfamily I DNA/RNA helicase
VAVLAVSSTKRLYLGAAGTGKTFRLRQAVEEWCRDRVSSGNVEAHHRILGLTFMHGSRVRMTERLTGLPQGAPPVLVETLDGFLLKLVRRFRRKLGLEGKPIHADTRDGCDYRDASHAFLCTFDWIRSQVLALLEDPHIRASIASSYPLLVVDEAQDCSPELWAIVERIAAGTAVLCAADPFQDLKGDGAGAEIRSWFDANGLTETLVEQRRTGNPRILATAKALRDGGACLNGISVEGVDGPHLAAFAVRQAVHRDKWERGVVILSPAGRSNSFVAKVISAVGSSPKSGSQHPAPFLWEGAAKDQAEGVLSLVHHAMIGKGELPLDQAVAMSVDPSLDAKVREVMRRSARRARRRGKLEIPREELEFAASQLAHAQRVSSIGEAAKRRSAMTIHQAKNREFEFVIVLWPYQIMSDETHQRRALYNAITRARRDARVLVQGGENRIMGDPLLSRLRG